VVSKTGSNDFHGSLFYFNRNRVTAANNFFSNRAGLPRPPFNRNEYGASLGGPIRRNKLFFHSAFEGYRAAASQTIVTLMPTGALRSGISAPCPRSRIRLTTALRFPATVFRTPVLPAYRKVWTGFSLTRTCRAQGQRA